ncbi:MAG TPA: hypothetical protein VF809_00615 [Candidatus Saccharimonadales bacterium]
MSERYNSPPNPGSAELDSATAESIGRAQLVRFAPTFFHEQGRPKDAGEFHVAVLCRGPGDTLTFGLTTQEAARQAGEDAGWMDLGTGGVGAVWVVTESGNKYGIGNGYVYNHNAGRAYALDHNAGQVQLRVGQRAVLPGAGTTSAIRSVLVNDEINHGSDHYSWTGKDASVARLVNEPVDPLLDVRAIGDAVSMGHDPSVAVSVLAHDVSQLRGNASFV